MLALRLLYSGALDLICVVCDVLCDVFFYVYCELQYLHFFFFNDTATTEIYTLSLHDALPILKSL